MSAISVKAGCLTIGVAAHGNVRVTIECLQSIFASVAGNFDLVLVDDASPDDMTSLFRQASEYHSGTRIFRFPENKEYSHSVNCILTSSQTEFALFISNDVFITPSYVSELLDVMKDGTVGIARGVSNFVDGFVDSKVHNVGGVEDIDSYERLVAFADSIHKSDRARITPDLFLTGDAFMTRRELIQQIGGFDTSFLGYLSDMDFAVRGAHAGFKRVVCGRAFAWHAKDSNISYLPQPEQDLKIQRRLARVDAAWKVFRQKWGLTGLSEQWRSTILREIPYAALDLRKFDPMIDLAPPYDYSDFLDA